MLCSPPHCHNACCMQNYAARISLSTVKIQAQWLQLVHAPSMWVFHVKETRLAPLTCLASVPPLCTPLCADLRAAPPPGAIPTATTTPAARVAAATTPAAPTTAATTAGGITATDLTADAVTAAATATAAVDWRWPSPQQPRSWPAWPVIGAATRAGNVRCPRCCTAPCHDVCHVLTTCTS